MMTGSIVLSEDAVRRMAESEDDRGVARKALDEARDRRAGGERVIFVACGENVFVLNKVYHSQFI